jgi:hypothetical protein
MNKFICILLLAVVIANAQDIPWDGNYTMLSVANIKGADSSLCCVPSALNIAKDQTNAQLYNLDLDFGAGLANCDPTLLGMINIQQQATFGRLFLNDASTTLTGAMVAYLLNNDTILLELQDGCHINYGKGAAVVTDLNYVDRYLAIWVVESFWSNDGNECCRSIQPVPNAYDDLTKTEAYIDAYPDDPVCPVDVRGTFTAFNNSVDGFGVIIGNYSEFMLANGSSVTLHAAPYCNVLYSQKKPTMSTNLCDYVSEIAGEANATNETAGEATTEVANTGGV